MDKYKENGILLVSNEVIKCCVEVDDSLVKCGLQF